MKGVSVRIDDEAHKKLGEIAKSEYMSKSKFLEKLIHKAIKEYGESKEK